MASSKQKCVTEEAVQCMICMEYDDFLKCDIKLIRPCSHVLCTVCLLNLSSVSTKDHPCKTCRYGSNGFLNWFMVKVCCEIE